MILFCLSCLPEMSFLEFLAERWVQRAFSVSLISCFYEQSGDQDVAGPCWDFGLCSPPAPIFPLSDCLCFAHFGFYPQQLLLYVGLHPGRQLSWSGWDCTPCTHRKLSLESLPDFHCWAQMGPYVFWWVIPVCSWFSTLLSISSPWASIHLLSDKLWCHLSVTAIVSPSLTFWGSWGYFVT